MQPGERPVGIGTPRSKKYSFVRQLQSSRPICSPCRCPTLHQRGCLSVPERLAVITLPDVNVLVALAWPNHVHHVAASAWFEAIGTDGWATCPVTEAGFVRVSCNPVVVQTSVTPLDAIAILKELIQLGPHTFWPLDQSILDLPETIGIRLQGYRHITDAMLLAIAMKNGGQLVTLDAGLEMLVQDRESHSLTVIPV